MPLFDFHCPACGQTSELLVTAADSKPNCPACGSRGMRKLLSAHSSMSGARSQAMPGPGDTACCGSAPGAHAGCSGPGSCCGKQPH